jgi:hypothetical protein
MVEQKRTFRTPGSVGQVVAASILGLCGIYLCVSAVLNENVVPAVVAAVQSASGLVPGGVARAGASPRLARRGAVVNAVPDEGPFFHGTKADLKVGDLLTAGFRSNYRPDVVMNHVYFTALVDGAGLAAELASGDGAPRVYLVEPTGPFVDDPNVTDKKFPGNPTRSYRSTEPIRVVGEVADWTRLTPEALQGWRDRLAVLATEERGEIIN